MISNMFTGLRLNLWKILTQLAALWISYKAIIDLQSLPPNSMKWKVIFYILSFTIVLLNAVLFTGLFTRFGEVIRTRITKLPINVKIITACILNIFPGLFFIYIEWGSYFSGAYFRFVTYLLVSILTALLLFQADNQMEDYPGVRTQFWNIRFYFFNSGESIRGKNYSIFTFMVRRQPVL